MCGRFSLNTSLLQASDIFNVETQEQAPPRYNIAPTQPVHVIFKNQGVRHLNLMRWGFLPSWVKEPETFSLIINARCETALQKPSFKSAMRHRRCIIPANGFYEWKREDGVKTPYYIKPRKQEIIGFAGLYETYMAKNGSEIDTMCFLTTKASRDIAEIHHRMPVLIDPEKSDIWLDCGQNRAQDLNLFFDNTEEGRYDILPVSNRINNARNDDAGLQDAIDEKEQLKQQAPETDQLTLF